MGDAIAWSTLKFSPHSSSIDVGFWVELAKVKLHIVKLSEEPREIFGFLSPSCRAQVPSRTDLRAESLWPIQHLVQGNDPAKDTHAGAQHSDVGSQWDPALGRGIRVPGTLILVNSIESFKALDRNRILQEAGYKILGDIASGRAACDPSLLYRFAVTMFADLKKWRFYYWFAFPALVMPHAAEALPPRPLAQFFAGQQLTDISAALAEWMAPSKPPTPPEDGGHQLPVAKPVSSVSLGLEKAAATSQPPPCVLISVTEGGARDDTSAHVGPDASAPGGTSVLPLTQLAETASLSSALLVYVCPGVLPTHPSWCLRNLLFLLWHQWRHGLWAPAPTRDGTAEPTSTSAAVAAPLSASDSGREGHQGAPPPALHVRVLCYRERSPGVVSEDRSLVVDVRLPSGSLGSAGEGTAASSVDDGSRDEDGGASTDRVKFVGWEHNAQGKLAPRMADLTSALDPFALAEAAVDLNLSLMRWRLMPSLATERIAATSCLLLGAGTLGCQVARCLMGWGVRKFTFVDNGCVAYSNPVRQSLFVFEDCLEGGKPKAQAAAERARAIFPGVTTEGVALNIPMIGHPVGNSEGEAARTLADLSALTDLILAHDVVFLLTDTRESRWLPTLVCAAHNKLAINVALGFDSFLVMRHGCDDAAAAAAAPDPGRAPATVAADASTTPGVTGHGEEEVDAAGVACQHPTRPKRTATPTRLGCYFCNDVVAPLDSTTGRSLDQQCTVTRPGLACIAGALAVELMVSVLQHPRRGSAPADGPRDLSEGTTLPFGDVPHQIRGFLPVFRQLVVTGQAFDRCTACSAKVVNEFRAKGPAFVLQALNSPAYLEEITGLTALKNAVDENELEWENDGGSDSDDF